jgi:hypothetical protein
MEVPLAVSCTTSHAPLTENQDDHDQLYMNNQDGLGEVNRLSHVTNVTSSWQRTAHYATLDGQPYNMLPNIPRRWLFLHSNVQWGGPGVRFFIDDIQLTPVITGDFDEDSDHDCVDVDALVAAIVAGATDSKFDLTDDGSVDVADLETHGVPRPEKRYLEWARP